MDDEYLDWFEERAAIIEYEGNVSREEAEKIAERLANEYFYQ